MTTTKMLPSEVILAIVESASEAFLDALDNEVECEADYEVRRPDIRSALERYAINLIYTHSDVLRPASEEDPGDNETLVAPRKTVDARYGVATPYRRYGVVDGALQLLEESE